MSTPQEHDYIGLTETSSMERSSETKLSSSSSSSTLNLKETELRLGLPGSDSDSESLIPEKKLAGSGSGSGLGLGVSLFGKDLDNGFSVVAPLKNLVSGSKRGFADANIGGSAGSGKWVFSVSSDQVDLGKKGAALFTPRGLECNGNSTQKPGPAMKDGVAVVPQSSKPVLDNNNKNKELVSADHGGAAPAAKAQVVGWPPIRSFRKNTMASNSVKNGDDSESKTGPGCLYVKVSMDGAPYLRKVDLKIYSNYVELASALEKMFSCFTIGQCSSHGLPGRDGLSESRLMDLLHGSEYVLTYEDKDHDWMLVGDVPWDMFTDCGRLFSSVTFTPPPTRPPHPDDAETALLLSAAHRPETLSRRPRSVEPDWPMVFATSSGRLDDESAERARGVRSPSPRTLADLQRGHGALQRLGGVAGEGEDREDFEHGGVEAA